MITKLTKKSFPKKMTKNQQEVFWGVKLRE
jgi:hypothetical protein